MTMPFVSSLSLAKLLRPEAYGHDVARIELRETLISWIILTGPYAYKIKKPLKLDYLDASTLVRREELCREELRLNRRFAPDLYLDVVSICERGGNLFVAASGEDAGPALEFAVRMHQFPEDQVLHELLAADRVSAAELIELGRRIAEFHALAPVSVDPYPHAERLRRSVLGNLASLLSNRESASERQPLGMLVDWLHDSLHEFEPDFAARQTELRIRDGHGDLHARNIVRYRGALTPFDCLEFDRELREVDVMNDIAFLVMDLCGHGRTDLACEFLTAYLAETGDYGGVRLLPFYAVHRALIRGYVDALAAGGAPSTAGIWRARMDRRIRTALEFIRPKRPAVIIMHGPSGSGKSFLSGQLIAPLCAIRIRSDRERKRLGEGLTQRELHGSAMTRRVYDELLAAAGSCLDGGFTVLIDAAFLDRGERDRFRALAAEREAGFSILSCRCDPDLMYQRVRARHGDVSDATPEVLSLQLSSWVPLAGDEAHAAVIDTAVPGARESALAAIRPALAQPARPGTPERESA